MSEPRQITVFELAALLMMPTIPQDAPVDVEGCDCRGECVGISVAPASEATPLSDAEPVTVMIRRSHGREERKYGKLVKP